MKNNDKRGKPVTLSGILIDRESCKPVYPAQVDAWDSAIGIAPLATAKVDRKGGFTLSLPKPPRTKGAAWKLLAFDGKRQRQLLREPVLVKAGGESRAIELLADPAPKVTPPAGSIAELEANDGVRLPKALAAYLKKKSLISLADVRLAGGLAAAEDLPVPSDDAAVRVIDAHASLAILTPEYGTRAALIASGMRDVQDLGRASGETAKRALSPLPPERARALHLSAQRQADAIDVAISEMRMYSALGKESLPQTCACTECQSATGPVAYLADLLDYATRYLLQGGVPVTLTFLENRLLQPLRSLPTSCAELNRRVRRIRICVEILRRHLGARAPTQYPVILELTYAALLAGIGTSYEEIRQVVRFGKPEDKQNLAARLQIPASGRLDDLFRDPGAPAGNALAVTEAYLNDMFGLRSTLIAPLAVARSPDATDPAQLPQLMAWQRRYQWDRWLTEDYSATAPTLEGRPIVDPDLVGLPDLVNVTPASTPRNQRPRTQWSVLDLLEDRQAWYNTKLGELHALIDGPAAGLAGRLATVMQQLQSPATSYPEVQRTGLEGLTVPAVRALRDRLRNGADVSADLSTLLITADEVETLGRVYELAANDAPILGTEWDDFYSILLSRIKRLGYYPIWLAEERQLQVSIDREPVLTGLTLSPWHFQPRSASALAAGEAWRPRAWRSTALQRRRYEDALLSRIEQQENLAKVLQGAVDAAEEVQLPNLLTVMLQIAQPPGVRLMDSTRALTDRYQIDFQEGACAYTTRIAQAIQTLQGVLYGVRVGLIDDAALTLDDPQFDAVWSWLGSYATWVAAVEVILYPENVLRPSLRTQPSQGFQEFIAELRTLGKLTSASARQAVAVYEEYFVDVCNLGNGVCATCPAPGLSGNEQYEYLVAKSASGRLYWCYFDAVHEQSFWRRLEIEGFDEQAGPLQLFGALSFTGGEGQSYFYFFAKQSGRERDRLLFGRVDLRADADWRALRWESGELEPLPEGGARFESARVATNRSPSSPIQLSIWTGPRTAYTRSLDARGVRWEAAGFVAVPAVGNWRRLGQGTARGGNDFACSSRQIAPRFILAGDFDRDGNDEIAILPNMPGTEGNDIWVMKFDAATNSWRHLLPPSGHGMDADIDIGAIDPPARFALAGDFDGDGFPEIAISADLSAAGAAGNIDNTGFWVKKFNPATNAWDDLGSPESPLPYGLSFASAGDWFTNLFVRYDARYAVVGDFDGDGRDEIAIAITPVSYVEIPAKVNANTFFIFDLELGSSGNHTWKQLPQLQCEPRMEIDVFNVRMRASRFALAAKFRPNDDRAILLVSKKLRDTADGERDKNLGNDFWACRFDGSSWQTLDPRLDCADAAIAVRFGVTGDFDGDGVPEVALAQAEPMPGTTSLGFWVEKLTVNGTWAPLATLDYGASAAQFAVAGDFDGDGADELAIVAENFPVTGVQVFDLNNGAWQRLAANNPNLVSTGGGLVAGQQPGQFAGDVFRTAGVAAKLLSTGARTTRQLVLCANPATDNTARAFAFDSAITGGWSSPCMEPEVRPAFVASKPVLPTPDIARARLFNQLVPAALGNLRRRTNRAYLDEMLFFVPLEIASRLRENGEYAAALDWCRMVWNFGAPPAERAIAVKLSAPADGGADDYRRWLLDPLDPHAIAATRPGTYLRYTLILIGRSLIEWADAEYARADARSLPLARELYERALELFNLQDIRPHTNACAELIDNLRRRIGEDEWGFNFETVFRKLAMVTNVAALAQATEEVGALLGTELSLPQQVARADAIVIRALEHNETHVRDFAGLLEDEADTRRLFGARVMGDKIRGRMIEILGVGDRNTFGRRGFVPAPALTLCIPPNPALNSLRQHAELCLRKMRDCLNIAGFELCVEPYGAVTAEAASPGFEQLPTFAGAQLQPLPYRYSTLIERTKQLVELARQLESSMLQFLSSAEQERYQELKARQDLELTVASVRLKDLQVIQSSDGVTAAGLQRDRAQIQLTHYRDLIANGWSVNEQLQFNNLVIATAHQHATAIAAWIEAAYGVGTYSNAIAVSGSAWSMNSQFHGLLASFERRAEEWRLARDLAANDLSSGLAQIRIANDQLAVSRQERAIAALQASHARTVVDFLVGKFLNADLYEWMADVTQRVYRFFLQQATQLARLAEWQLAFERQEPPARLIKADYWERPSDGMTPDVGASSTGTNSLRGLTGSARLLRDVFELDQYAFTKNQRKQQVTETLSLAQLDPFAFQVFRETGRLNFATPMSYFDRRSPGEYLRLIQRVRTSIVALIPPPMGIRATLASIGTTRVTIGPDRFRTVSIQRGPQLVSLSSPFNASGLFDLDAQPELLVPFEGLGVDGQWVLDLPKSSNPFDFNAIADVLVTIDYTALHSADYEAHLRATSDRRFAADRAFSFRNEFADAWYDLNNPEVVDNPAVPMTVSFTTRRADFPPNVVRPMIRQVALMFVQDAGDRRVVPVSAFFSRDSSGNERPANAPSRSAQSNADGVVSTRAGAWSGLVGGSLEGDVNWTLTLPASIKPRFKQERITDILLVISYEGEYAR